MKMHAITDVFKNMLLGADGFPGKVSIQGIATLLQVYLRNHQSCITINYNDHAGSCHDAVAEKEERANHRCFPEKWEDYDWGGPEELQKALDNNSVWIVSWSDYSQGYFKSSHKHMYGASLTNILLRIAAHLDNLVDHVVDLGNDPELRNRANIAWVEAQRIHGLFVGSPIPDIDDWCTSQELEAKLLALLKHKYSSLCLDYNDYVVNHATVQEELDEGINKVEGTDFEEGLGWVNVEDRQKAVHTNCRWSLSWYPNSTVGSVTIAASGLDILLPYVFKHAD